MPKLQQMTILVHEYDPSEACHRCSRLRQKCHKFVMLPSIAPCWECISQGEHSTCSFKDSIDQRLLVTFKEVDPNLPFAHLQRIAENCSSLSPIVELNTQQSNEIAMQIEEAVSKPIFNRTQQDLKNNRKECDFCSAHAKPCNGSDDASPSSRVACTNCQASNRECKFTKRRKPPCFPCILRKTPCRGSIPCTACSERETIDRCKDQSIEFGDRLEHVNDNCGNIKTGEVHISHIGDYHIVLGYVLMLKITIFDFFNHIQCGFTIAEFIGSGAVMSVYEGYLIEDGRNIKIALKIPRNFITGRTNINQTNNILADIRQEIRIMKHLEKYPSIVSLLGVAFKDLNPVLVVEYATTNLTNHLISRRNAHDTVDWKTKMRFCCEIADGVQAVHNIGVVHGDLKADNILLFAHLNEKDRLVAKISDFGFSVTGASIAEGRNTGWTPRYCAPECIPSAPRKIRRNWADQKPKDNYSYGLLVWQTAQNGDEPFSGMKIEEIDDLKLRQMHEEYFTRLIDDLDEGVPDEFKNVIKVMTVYNPKDRAQFEKVREIMACFDNDSGHVGSGIDVPIREPPRRTELPDIKPAQLVSIPPPIKAELFRTYKEEALNKNDVAAFFLSVCYGSGFGVEVNKREMVTWAIKAAEYGNLQAIKDIASQFSFWELPDNRNEMFGWLLRAANDGHRDSIKWIAFCYCYGVVVSKDNNKWEEWKKKFKNTPRLEDESRPSLKLELHFAAGEGNIEAVKFIIQQTKTNIGAVDVVNAVDEFNRTPLHIAAEHGREELVNILLNEYDADINAKDSSGCTPLYVAAGNDHVGVVKALLKLSANVDIKDDYGWTAMHEAALKGNINVIRLLKEKMDVNATSESGETPLLLAVERNHIDAVKLLIEYGADKSIMDEYGRTALSLAQNSDILKALQM